MNIKVFISQRLWLYGDLRALFFRGRGFWPEIEGLNEGVIEL
jgi:hypothetical protein